MDFDPISYLVSKGHRGRPVSGGREIVYSCFFDCKEPPDSRKKKLYVNAATGQFDCKVCGQAGGSFTLQKFFGDEPRPGTTDDAFLRGRILDAAADVGASILDNNSSALLYLAEDRALSYDTITSRKLGLVAGGWSLVDSITGDYTAEQLKSTGLVVRDGNRAGKDFFTRHLLIPYLRRGHVIQMRGRAWGEVKGGKYLTGPGEIPRVYNADSLDGAEEVIITEGEFDAMILQQSLLDSPEERARRIAVIGMPGTNAIPEELPDLLTNVKRIYIGFDSDEPGKRAAESLKETLGNRTRVLTLPYEDGIKCDWSEYLLPEPERRARFEHPYAGHDWRDVLRMMSSASGKRIFSIAEAGEAYRAYRETHDGLATGFVNLDATIKPGLLPGQVLVVLAKTGCVAGGTELQVNRAGKGFRISIADLLDRWEGKRYAWDLSCPTYIQREDKGVVRLVRIKNAWRSGVKTTYTVTTSSGRSIRATRDHPFLTPDGWRRLGDLEPGQSVMVNAGRSKVGSRQPKANYSKRSVPAHPFAGRRNVRMGGHSVPFHRLVMEAHLNGLSAEEFIDHLRDPGADIVGLAFLDPKVFEVHHLDHNHLNNDIDNLAVLTHAGHHVLHGREGKFRQVLEQVDVECIESIVEFGTEETYDIEVEDDPHNFLANGFVVHNSGKTLWLCNLAYNMRAVRVLFISLEMTREEIYDRMRRIYLFHNPTHNDRQIDQGLANVFVCDENRLGERDISSLVSEFAIEAGEKPDVVFVDYLGYYARGARGNSPYEKTSNAVMQLKAEAKAGRFVIVTPSQVNRGAKEGKPIDLDDARDAGSVEETADFLLALYRPDDALMNEAVVNNQPQSGKVKLSVLKSRHGGKGKVFSLQMDLLTLAVVDDGTPAARRAVDHNQLAWRGQDWESLRKHETRPRQIPLEGLPRGNSK